MNRTDPDMSPRFAEEFYKHEYGIAELARRLGCHISAINRWLYNDSVPGPYYLRRLHKLGYDIMYILTGERHV